MSQTATIYRVSKDTFRELEAAGGDQPFDTSTAKNYAMFQGSFMGLEFILSKEQDDEAIDLVAQIFNPKQSLGNRDFDDPESVELYDYLESGNFISYLDPATISRLNSFLENISAEDIDASYDADELNDNGIYPGIWHNDNSPDKAYNQQHLVIDLNELKTIVKEAIKEQDYLFVFVG